MIEATTQILHQTTQKEPSDDFQLPTRGTQSIPLTPIQFLCQRYIRLHQLLICNLQNVLFCGHNDRRRIRIQYDRLNSLPCQPTTAFLTHIYRKHNQATQKFYLP